MEWLRIFEPRPRAGSRLFCFPHAGGGAASYRPWTAMLRPDVELVAVQYPGRQDRFGEPCAESLEELVAGATAEIAGLLDRPYAFFGHSMGATVAFEAVRALTARGLPEPRRLFVSARSAPSESEPVRVDTADDADLLAHVRGLGSAGGAHLDAEPRLRPLVLPSLRADLAVVNSYRYRGGEPVRCPVTAIAGSTDHSVGRREIAAWQRHTTLPVELLELPGGHFYLEESAQRLLSVLNDRV
ncbi:thioesterase [Saccharothrix coeruleofusca]|uniref:Thioesterase n=2 Tax=Saccharothrix coeruleofusca TaxID=33919 RepID=A0A918EG37_9PSEU|nr:thioesterase [Saccharothrix coeruleofusca]